MPSYVDLRKWWLGLVKIFFTFRNVIYLFVKIKIILHLNS